MLSQPLIRSTATCRKCSEYRLFATRSFLFCKVCLLLLSHFWGSLHSTLEAGSDFLYVRARVALLASGHFRKAPRSRNQPGFQASQHARKDFHTTGHRIAAAASATAAMSGTTVTTLRQGNQQIPVIPRLRATERAQLSDVENLCIYSSQGSEKIPLRSVSSVVTEMATERIRRQEHFRTIGVHAFPVPGVLPSEVLRKAMPQLTAFGKTIPPGYRMEIGGERAKQQSGFANLAEVLAISLLGIYGALLLQFGNAVKPLLAFAATPYGVAGALVCLAVMARHSASWRF